MTQILQINKCLKELGTSYRVEYTKNNKSNVVHDFVDQRSLNKSNSIDGSVVSFILKNRKKLIEAAYQRM